MIVRPALGADVETLAAIHARSFEAPWSAGDLGALLVNPGAFGLIALVRAAAAGFILCRAAADEAEVLTLAILPSCRRIGLATALLDAAATRARQDGAGVLFLEVAADNLPALALYRGRDFLRVGQRPAYYARAGAAADALVLRRDLNR